MAFVEIADLFRATPVQSLGQMITAGGGAAIIGGEREAAERDAAMGPRPLPFQPFGPSMFASGPVHVVSSPPTLTPAPRSFSPFTLVRQALRRIRPARGVRRPYAESTEPTSGGRFGWLSWELPFSSSVRGA